MANPEAKPPRTRPASRTGCPSMSIFFAVGNRPCAAVLIRLGIITDQLLIPRRYGSRATRRPRLQRFADTRPMSTQTIPMSLAAEARAQAYEPGRHAAGIALLFSIGDAE